MITSRIADVLTILESNTYRLVRCNREGNKKYDNILTVNPRVADSNFANTIYNNLG